MDEERQTTEVREGDGVRRQTTTTTRSADGAMTAQRIIWYIAGFIMVFLALRIILLLLAANQGNAFVDLVYTVGGFFAAPFTGIFGSPTFGEFFFDTASVVAIVVYGLVAWGLAKAFTLTGRPEV